MKSLLSETTIIVGLDAAHLREFQLSYPTWIKNKPELRDCPLLAVCDFGELELEFMRLNFSEWPTHTGGVTLCHRSLLPRCQNQREKMLTALALLPSKIQTKYFLKLDTDTLATEPGGWLPDHLFRDDMAFIASPWSYTKPASALETLDRWAASFPACNKFAATKPLAPQATRIDSEKDRIFMPRITSYVYFGRTDWHREMAELVLAGSGSSMASRIVDSEKAEFPPGRLPVPSQDTFHWYCAERLGVPYLRHRFSRHGWAHCGGSFRKLKELAAEAMA